MFVMPDYHAISERLYGTMSVKKRLTCPDCGRRVKVPGLCKRCAEHKKGKM